MTRQAPHHRKILVGGAAMVVCVALLAVVVAVGRPTDRTAAPGGSTSTADAAASPETTPADSAEDPGRPTGGSPGGAAPVAPAVVDQVDRDGTAPVIVGLALDPTAETPAADRDRQVAEATAQLLARLPAGSYDRVTELPIAGAVALTVDATALAALSADPLVAVVDDDPVFTTASDPVVADPSATDALAVAPASVQATASVGAPQAWQAGFDGAGSTVAVLDTGVQSTHPYLQGPGGSKVVAEACFSASCPGGSPTPISMATQPGSGVPCAANCTHGTHVAGIVAGGGTGALPAGVAPGASLVAVQVFTQTGTRTPMASTSHLIAALQWLEARVRGGQLPGLVAVNMSLGGSSFLPGTCDAANPAMKTAIDALRTVGVVTVIAAGNNVPAGRTSAPGCISTAVAVGAVDDTTLTVASFSAISTDVDVLAPGVAVSSSVPGTVNAPAAMADMSGTSMATPAVAGALAVLADARPALDPFARVALVRDTGRPLVVRGLTLPYLSLPVALDPTGLRPTFPPGGPFGNWESLSAAPGVVTVSGWAIDPDDVGAAELSVTVGSSRSTVVADRYRADLAAAFPTYGGSHGFSATVPASGSVTVCLAGRDVGPGADTSFGCRSVVVPSGSPFGNFEMAVAGPGTVSVGGWAIDPDTVDPVSLTVSVNGAVSTVVADRFRPDVGAAFRGYGDLHGFSATLPVAVRGSASVCVTVRNQSAGADVSFGCRSVVVPSGSPFGNVDVVRGAPGAVAVAGWAIDPDTVDPVVVSVTVDGVATEFLADQFRPDVGAAFRGYGDAHGFSVSVPAAAGSRRVCVVALNQGAGAATALPCRVVVVG